MKLMFHLFLVLSFLIICLFTLSPSTLYGHMVCTSAHTLCLLLKCLSRILYQFWRLSCFLGIFCQYCVHLNIKVQTKLTNNNETLQ